MKYSSLIVLALCCALVFASRREENLVRFRARTIDVNSASTLSQALKERTVSVHPSRDDQFIVHFKKTLSNSEKDEINAALAPSKLGAYIPSQAYIVHASLEKVLALESHSLVKWIGHLEADLRVQPDFQTRVAQALEVKPNRARAENGEAVVALIVALPHESPRSTRRTLAEAQAIGAVLASELGSSAVVKTVSFRRLRVEVPLSLVEETVAQLSRTPEVQWVEVEPAFQTSNYFGARSMQVGQDAGTTTPLWSAALDGTGQIVGVADTGVDISSCFFSDPTQAVAYWPNTNTAHRKIVSYHAYVDDTDEVDGHGTHVAGSVLGNSNDPDYTTSNGAGRGAKLFFNDIGDTATGGLDVPNDLTILLSPAYTTGARIHSNSWGVPTVSQTGQKYGTYYSLTSSEMDDFTDVNRDFLLLVAAGNDGEAGDQTVGAPATAKSILAVAAAMNTELSWEALCGLTPSPVGLGYTCPSLNIAGDPTQYSTASMASFSSQGPLTDDSRIKPDIAASGMYVISARSSGPAKTNECAQNTGIMYNAGTSMATPLTAGAASIVRQYFTEGYYPTGTAVAGNAFNPTASLMKATMLGGARTMTGLNLQSQAQLGAIPSYTQGYGYVDLPESIKVTGVTPATYNFAVLSNEGSSATTASTQSWVISATGTGPIAVTLVWSDPAAAANAVDALINDLDLTVVQGGTTLWGNGADGGDPVNPNEQVNIANPTGQYTITVTGYAVNDGPQSYSLVAHGGFTVVSGNTGVGSGTETPSEYYSSSAAVNETASSSTVVAPCVVVAVAAFVAAAF